MAKMTPPMGPGKGKPKEDKDTKAEMARDKKRGITEVKEDKPAKKGK